MLVSESQSSQFIPPTGGWLSRACPARLTNERKGKMNLRVRRGVGKGFLSWEKEMQNEKMSLQVLMCKSVKFKDADFIMQTKRWSWGQRLTILAEQKDRWCLRLPAIDQSWAPNLHFSGCKRPSMYCLSHNDLLSAASTFLIYFYKEDSFLWQHHISSMLLQLMVSASWVCLGVIMKYIHRCVFYPCTVLAKVGVYSSLGTSPTVRLQDPTPQSQAKAALWP